ncbi:MAG: 2-amino-4-hydroxy-6-hydroxymethyldihydropteridine diphosphokinase [Candidatus Omnitrophica bacterium]|nr:2-amino-4-hydroxy-6-hydroxymethyldihydropteridine diphosphokinase [Candidatus Omnitrophota bacterium]
MSRVFIGIGSNDGDRLESISSALKALGAAAGIRVVQMAVVSETDPVGGPPQGPYLNTVAEIATSLSPRRLLATLQGIERQLGRSPSSERWGPRVIDLDILLYDDRIIQEPDLCVPHPRMHERRFVLEPLSQLVPDIVHPLLQKTAAVLLEQLIAQPAVPTSPLAL